MTFSTDPAGTAQAEPAGLWDYPAPFTQTLSPGEGDIDGLQHTNNAVYVRWCEMVAWAHSEAIGMSLADYHRLDRAMAIRRGEYDYRLPSVSGDVLCMGTWLTATDGRMGFERRFQLLRIRDGATILRGRWELVCIEISSGRPRRMPPAFLQVYLPAIVTGAGISNEALGGQPAAGDVAAIRRP